jgi:PmbA protein
VNHPVTNSDTVQADVDRLSELARDVVARCLKKGASQSEVSMNLDRGLNVNVRMGEVETVEHTRDRGVSVTVYFGGRKGSASTADLQPDSIATTVEQACAIARHTEEDPFAGLADADRMAKVFPDLDLWHPWALDAEHAIALGIECERAARDTDPRISNSDGASVGSAESVSVYANSHGFVGADRSTRHSLSCSMIAEDEHGMQRDYWYTSTRRAADMEAAEAVGRRAAERTLARLHGRKLGTRECPVLYVPEVARSLIGHLVSAVSGGALYRKASFLLDHQGRRILPEWFGIEEDPFIVRGHGSGAFDAEGVAAVRADLVTRGVLSRYVLGSYSARKLGLASTGNAGGIHNLRVAANAGDQASLIAQMGEGLLLTEVMGQGVNTVTGDYSRGAAGFWVENGAIAYPVDEITVAGNLRQMFQDIVAVGSDVDDRSQVLTGSILIGRMMVAGAA